MFATDAMNTDLVDNEHTEIENVEKSDDDDDDDKNEELVEICSDEESEDGRIIEW